MADDSRSLVEEIAALRTSLAKALGDAARLKSENQSLRNDVEYWYRLAQPRIIAALGGSVDGTAAEAGSESPRPRGQGQPSAAPGRRRRVPGD